MLSLSLGVVSFWAGGGTGRQKLDAAVARFTELSQSPAARVAAVYARQAESAIQAEGVGATRTKNSASARMPWQLVGRVV